VPEICLLHLIQPLLEVLDICSRVPRVTPQAMNELQITSSFEEPRRSSMPKIMEPEIRVQAFFP
jgi:hypothetical protein